MLLWAVGLGPTPKLSVLDYLADAPRGRNMQMTRRIKRLAKLINVIMHQSKLYAQTRQAPPSILTTSLICASTIFLQRNHQGPPPRHSKYEQFFTRMHIHTSGSGSSSGRRRKRSSSGKHQSNSSSKSNGSSKGSGS